MLKGRNRRAYLLTLNFTNIEEDLEALPVCSSFKLYYIAHLGAGDIYLAVHLIVAWLFPPPRLGPTHDVLFSKLLNFPYNGSILALLDKIPQVYEKTQEIFSIHLKYNLN